MVDPNYRTIMISHDFYDEMNIEYLTGKYMIICYHQACRKILANIMQSSIVLSVGL